MSVIPEGYSQVQLRFGGNACPFGAMTTFGVKNDTALSPTTIGITVQGDWVANISSNWGDDATLVDILVKNGPNDTGPSDVHGTNNAGGAAGDTLPPNVSVLVRKSTASGGRRNRGRMYIPGYLEAHSDPGGVLNSGALAALSSDWDDFLDALVADDLPMVILHDVPVLTPTLVTELEVQARLATQRLRLRR